MPKAKAASTSLVLRTCSADMSSQNNFVWPAVGKIAEAPDWIGNKECGNGLHGWLFGHGDHSCSSYLNGSARWLVVEVESDTIVMLGGKCKFPRAKVVFVGDKKDATDYLLANEPRAKNVEVIGACLTVGEKQAAIVGALGTATAGDSGTATAGDSGTATAGYSGTATAGYSGTATAGYSGTATAGYRGEIRIRWYDEVNDRYRTVIGYVGEDGIEANVAYRLDENHKLVKA